MDCQKQKLFNKNNHTPMKTSFIRMPANKQAINMKAYIEHADNLPRRCRQSLQWHSTNLIAHRTGLHFLLPCKFVCMMLGRPKCTACKTKLLLVLAASPACCLCALLTSYCDFVGHACAGLATRWQIIVFWIPPTLLDAVHVLGEPRIELRVLAKLLDEVLLPASIFFQNGASKCETLDGPSTLKLPPLVCREPIISSSSEGFSISAALSLLVCVCVCLLALSLGLFLHGAGASAGRASSLQCSACSPA